MGSDINSSKISHVMDSVETVISGNFKNYNVFLNHRGADTKTGFVGFLYKELERFGLQPFLDCGTSIEDVVKNTPIAILIFSKKYAESVWCLKELHLLLETHRDDKKDLPIFYNIKPWDLRNPDTSRLKDGFQKLKEKFDETIIEEWRADLKEASTLMGWEHSDAHKRLEKGLVMEVANKVMDLANKPLPLNVGEYVVGVKQIADEIIQELFQKRKWKLALWGMGGIGKSTLARELYNRLHTRFEATCFVEDVTEKLKQGGVVNVQNKIMKDVCSNNAHIHDKSKGKSILEERLCKKLILVVLDDVADSEMLDYMITRKMLLKGSMCIVTSRDEHVFQTSNVFNLMDEMYVHNVKPLNVKDSKQLFTSHTFEGDCQVRGGLEELVTNISGLCGGVPLVLKVCGALLRRENDRVVWEEVKRKLEYGAIMNEEKIFQCLWISYDSLGVHEKDMFLDIACALIGQEKDKAICTWATQGWYPGLSIRTLMEKALISIDGEDCFTMHDHLRDMGRQIEKDEGKSLRRLWMPEALSILKQNKPLSSSLQTLVITSDYDGSDGQIDLDLSHMNELRIIVYDCTVKVTSIPANLQWLNGPQDEEVVDLSNLPNVVPESNQLVVLDISLYGQPLYEVLNIVGCFTKLEILILDFNEVLDSRSKHISISLATMGIFNSKHINLRCLDLSVCHGLQLCPTMGDFQALEELQLSHCYDLVELPNLQKLTCLKVLDITECSKIKVVSGLGDLVALVELQARGCDRLFMLPDMHKLTNLQVLNVRGSPLINNIPGLCDLRALRELKANYKVLEACFDFCNLVQLVTLGVQGWSKCGLLAFAKFTSLEKLTITSCKDVGVLAGLLNLTRLQSLELWGCGFKDVSCLSNLIGLRSLRLTCCEKLEILPDMHKLTSLEILEIGRCHSLRVWAIDNEAGLASTLKVGSQPRVWSLPLLHTLTLNQANIRELPDLSLFPRLRVLDINGLWSLERLTSIAPMTALEKLTLWWCKSLKGVPNLSHSKSWTMFKLLECDQLSLMSTEIKKLRALCHELQIQTNVYTREEKRT